MLSKYFKLDQTASKLLTRLDQFDKLRAIANKKNYYYKVKQIHVKVSEQYEFWIAKSNSKVLVNATEKLVDLQKDLNFIESQLNNLDLNKERVDILAEKYDISYGKNNKSDH